VPTRISMPGFIKPQLATLKSKAPEGDQWLHETKYDGYRIQVHASRGRKKVYTRNGLDWTNRFSSIAGALGIPGEAIIDGEVVVVHEGRANFLRTTGGASALAPDSRSRNVGRSIWFLQWTTGNALIERVVTWRYFC
jgi:ATP dependent DNA ligase domain